MALDYTSLFEDIGSIIRAIDLIFDMTNDTNTPDLSLPDELDNIQTVFQSNNAEELLSGLPNDFYGYMDNATAWIASLRSRVTARLLHDTVTQEIGGNNIQEVLSNLIREMNNDSETVNAPGTTVGSPVAEGSNNGTGTVYVTDVLDGATQPDPRYAANTEYNGETSYLADKDDTFTFECIQDEDSGGLPMGEERFSVRGLPVRPGGPFGRNYNESGRSGWQTDMPTLNSYQIVANKDFESWDSQAPVNWDVDAGTAGTHVVQESSSSNIYRGDAALRFDGDGAQAAITISQSIPSSLFVPLKRYMVCCAVKTSGAGILAGQLDIKFAGTGYTAAGSEDISMNTAALVAQVTYGQEFFYINMPATLPEDWELTISVTGTLTSGESIWVDSLAVGPLVYGDGVGWAITAGSAQWIRGDRVTCRMQNDDTGVFSRFFRKAYGVQLPQVTGGTETISDTLAQ